MPVKVKAIPEGYEGATPYLVIKGAADGIEFYSKGFGATEIMRIPAVGGMVGHAAPQPPDIGRISVWNKSLYLTSSYLFVKAV